MARRLLGIHGLQRVIQRAVALDVICEFPCVYRLNLYFKLYLFIYFSYIVYLFTFPLRLAALKPKGFLTEGFNNEKPPLLPLGAAAAKRYIYHRYQHQSTTRAL